MASEPSGEMASEAARLWDAIMVLERAGRGWALEKWTGTAGRNYKAHYIDPSAVEIFAFGCTPVEAMETLIR